MTATSERIDLDVVRIIVEAAWLTAQNEEKRKIRQIIISLRAETPETGHGKAQRAFANRLLRRYWGENCYELP